MQKISEEHNIHSNSGSKIIKSQLNKKICLLNSEIKKLRKNMNYGLVWDDQSQVVIENRKNQYPVLDEFSELEINSKLKHLPMNLLIEGDNYNSLSVLSYTHTNKIDMIYIDPPYNTGGTLMYNNNYVDKDDSFVHSKFLSILYYRLRIAKMLLKKNGVICCTIDNHELLSVLGVLEKFNARLLNIVVIVIKPEGRNQKGAIMSAHEYAIFATWGEPTARRILPRTEVKQQYPEMTNDGQQYRWDTFYRRGDKKLNPENQSRWYPIYVNEKTLELHLTNKKGYKKVLPIDTNGTKWIWDMLKMDLDEVLQNLNKDDPEIIAKKNPKSNQITIHIKRWKKYYSKPLSFWNHPDYSPQSYGSKIIPKILDKDIKFDYPKSVFAVYDCIDIFLPEDGVVLDFFAGSGTTGHATQLLNLRDKDMNNAFIKKYGKEYYTHIEFLKTDAKLYSPFDPMHSDKTELTSKELSEKWKEWKQKHAKRHFILCTNNEIPEKILQKLRKNKSWDEKNLDQHSEGICKKITYPRMKGISKDWIWNKDQSLRLTNPLSSEGHIVHKKSSGDKVPKIQFRMKYFKTTFVNLESITDQSKKEFVNQSTEILCIKENCFEKVKNKQKFIIFKNFENKYIGIIYHDDGIEPFKNEIKNMFGNKNKIHTYVFSLSDEVDTTDFEEVQQLVNLKSIPISILNVYRRIFTND